jgi:hypothetical protein
LYFLSTVLILAGVLALFIVSSFGGLGKDALSAWWGLTFIPHPLGWILDVVLLIIKFTKRRKSEVVQ